MLDIGDVPAGLAALDALIKEARVEIVGRGTVQPGRYLILFAGGVEAVQFADAKAREAAGGALVDQVLLPYADERILPALLDGLVRWPHPGETLGVLQSASSPKLLAAVDRALKGAEVGLVQLRIAEGLAGKALCTLWGHSYDVEAAIELADTDKARIIRNADPEVAKAMTGGTHFFGGWRG